MKIPRGIGTIQKKQQTKKEQVLKRGLPPDPIQNSGASPSSDLFLWKIFKGT